MAPISVLKSIPPQILMRLKGINLNIPSDNCNQEINSLLQRTVLMGGKRLRPMLTYLMADFFGLELDKADVCASSIELVHAASLSHDDVIDQATTRRGGPTLNMVSSNKRAVLAGDYLLASVIVSLTRLGRLDLVSEMGQVIEALSEGEWLQLDASESRIYSEEAIEKIALFKTASVMSWCSVAPCLLKGYSENIIKYARYFGENLGVAFQLLDDTLDFSGQSQKDTQLDLKNGIVNAVVFEWLLLNPQAMESFQQGESIVDLWAEEGLEKAIGIVRTRALEKLNRCRDILNIMSSELENELGEEHFNKKKRPLLEILNFLENRKY
jgi:geranylgeranyl pyrophosphate synthase